jgi:hypothetical protein
MEPEMSFKKYTIKIHENKKTKNTDNLKINTLESNTIME